MMDKKVKSRRGKGKIQFCKVTGKIKLQTETDAKIALAFGAGKKGSIRYYPCPFCKTFHTTSQEYKKRDELNANT